MSAPRFHELAVSAVRELTEHSVAITFAVPDELTSSYAHLPGQYLTLRTTIDGADIRRSYSICSHHKARELEVGIKRVPGGAFSQHAQELQAGDRLRVMTPQGRFTAAIGGKHSYLLIAAGSGITPCLAIAHSVLDDEPESTVNLLYSNQSTKTTMFLHDLAALKNRHMARFNVTYVMSRERMDIELFNGRLDGERISRMSTLGLVKPRHYDGIYICGPQAMIDDASTTLSSLGADPARIHFELFATEHSPRARERANAERDAIAEGMVEGTPVTIIMDGTRREIVVNGAEETVLAAAQRTGLDMPFSCAGGMCCTCRCKVIAGQTKMDLNYSLADWEVAAGFTLACQSRPVSDELVLDFDRV